MNQSILNGRRGGRICALLALVAVVFAVLPARPGRADGDPGYVVAPTSSTTNLTDGQRILINLKSTSPDVSISFVEIHECFWDATYTVAADVLADTGKCPNRPVSSSADYFVDRGSSDGLTALARTANGANVPFLVGQGVVEWTSATKHTLTCDPTHPCALVLKINIVTAGQSSTVFQKVKLSFSDDNPLKACGGFAKNVITTGGSDEISDAWIQWTRSQCQKTHKGAPTRVSFLGEGPSVQSFVSGSFDLVYTAAGYDAAVGLAPTNAATQRPVVSVPIALNASVIAAGGGQHQLVGGAPIGDKARYPDGSLQLTASEVGAMLGGGLPWLSRNDHPYSADILARNPDLNGFLYASDANIYAPSVSLASSWFLTNYLATVAPDDFVVPGAVPPPKHGAVASMALANPAFGAIGLYTGRPTLAKASVPEELSAPDGPLWAMTDLASARALDLTPVALQAGGGFVAPTEASMDAAVAAMTPDANGLLLPTPALATTTAAAGAVQPYPLTYVMYALVPQQPLVDPATCQLRSGSQLELGSWLDYITGTGQGLLPAGMQKLPPALLLQARAALANVGVAKITGPCAGKQHPDGGGGGGTTTTTTTTTVPSGSGGGSTGGFGSGSGFNGTGTTIPGSPSTGVTVPGTGGGSNGGGKPTKASEANVKIPGFAGRNDVGALGGVLALVGIALLMSLAAWLTATGIFGAAAGVVGAGAGAAAAKARVRMPPLRRIGALAALWIGVSIAGITLVLFALGPMLQQRDQRALLTRYRVTVSNAANIPQGLPGSTATVAKPPANGDPVGIIEIGALKSQDVVIEGVGASQTSKGPGHVPGTAGLGQPGNSVLVARHAGYGGAFSHLGSLHSGDQIVVTTTQGQSLYTVSEINHVSITGDDGTPDDSVTAAGDPRANAHLTAAATGPSVKTVKTSTDALFGKSDDDRLTLVTASSHTPWDTSSAIEVVAKLSGRPFEPTAQQSRSASETGTHGDRGVLAAVVLALLAFAGVVAGSVLLFHKLRFRTAYVLSIAPLVAITVITGETLVRLLPAWT